MSRAISPIQTPDRQLNRFNREAIAEADRLDRRIAARTTVGRYEDRPPDLAGLNGDTWISDPYGGTAVHDGTLWRPYVNNRMCRAPGRLATWSRFNIGTSGFFDAYDTIHGYAWGAEGRQGALQALTVTGDRWAIEAAFDATLGQSSAASQATGFGVIISNAAETAVTGVEFYTVLHSTSPPRRMLRGGYGGSLSGGAGATWSGSSL